MASDENPASSNHDTGQPTRSIYIGNIPHNTTGAEIRERFLEYGPIQSVSPGIYAIVTRGYAFVNFYNFESAARAVKEAQGRHLFGQTQGGVTVTFAKSHVAFRLPSHTREYASTTNLEDEWFEYENVPGGPTASANASSPRGPRSMVRDVSPPDVKRTNFSMQGSFPRNHVHRSSYSYTTPRRSSDDYHKPEDYYEKSTARRAGIDPSFPNNKNFADYSRENEYEDEVLDQNEWDEVQDLQKKARSLKAPSTKGHWEATTQPVTTRSTNASEAESSRGTNGSLVETTSTRQDRHAPLEKSSKSRLTTRSRLPETDDHSSTRSSSTSSLQRLRYADCKNLDGPLTPSSPKQLHMQAKASTRRQPSPELGGFRARTSREFFGRHGPTAHHTAGSSSSASKAKELTIHTEAPSSDWIDSPHYPSSPRRVEAARVAKLYKEVTCARWLRDSLLCKFTSDPDQCLFTHHDTGIYLRAPFRPESMRGFTCPTWLSGKSCSDPEGCGYAHSDTGRYLNENLKPKTRHITCTFWFRRNRCRFSDNECLFAHHDTGQYASDVPPADRNPVQGVEKDWRWAGANNTYIQKTSMSPNTPAASGLQARNGSFEHGKLRMRPPATNSPPKNTENTSSRSHFRKTTLPQSDYFGNDIDSCPRGPSPSKPGYVLRHGVDTPHSPQPTISSTDGCSQRSATANPVMMDDLGLQNHTKAIPAGRDQFADDDRFSTEPGRAGLKSGPEIQALTAQKTNHDRAMPDTEGPIKTTPEKHFARPSAILLDPRKRRKQSKVVATASPPADLDAGIAQPSVGPLSVTSCKACGKKLFGPGDYCINCREKRVSASQAAAKIPTPAQSPSTVDDSRPSLDGINIPQALADGASRPESIQGGNTNIPTIEETENSALQSGQPGTLLTGPKLAATVIPAKRSASSASPFISKKRRPSQPIIEGLKRTSSTLYKPKPSLEELTQEALRRNSEVNMTGSPQKTKDVNTSSHSSMADESLDRPSVCSRSEDVNTVSSEKEPHPLMDQEKVNATLERAEDGSANPLSNSVSHALPKLPNGILSDSEALNRDLGTGQIAGDASALSTNPASPSAAAGAQPNQSHLQNHNKRRHDDEDQLFERAFKYPRLERDGSKDSQTLSRRVARHESISEDDENVSNYVDHPVTRTLGSTIASENCNADDNVDETNSNDEVVESEGVVQQDLVATPDQVPVLSDIGSRPMRAQADEEFDEAAHLERLRANGAIIEEESDEEEESDNDVADAASSTKTKEYQTHLGLTSAVPMKVSRDLFEIAPHFRPVVQPAEPSRYCIAGQPKPSKKELWKNLLSYQCSYRRKRFGNPHQMIDELPERTVYATVLESAPSMANDVVGRPSIFDVAPVVEKKRKMTMTEFLGGPKDPVIVRDGPKGNLVLVDREQLQNETKGRRVTIEKFPFING